MRFRLYRRHGLDLPSHIRTYASSRWTYRQSSDPYTRSARLAGLKSRAAFKLLQLNDRHHLFLPGQTVIDLGFAPGSWSQVAIDLTKPGGRVLGVDLLPAQPPRGVSSIQGDFLSPDIQAEIKGFLRDPERGRVRSRQPLFASSDEQQSYIDLERRGLSINEDEEEDTADHEDRTVDVVLSDMCEAWELASRPFARSLAKPYARMMNTSGNGFRDHVGSMDLCRSALHFAYSTLKVGGHFVCKFYQGAEDKKLENSLKALFHKVHREKPDSSRSESKEGFFVCLKRLARSDPAVVFDAG